MEDSIYEVPQNELPQKKAVQKPKLPHCAMIQTTLSMVQIRWENGTMRRRIVYLRRNLILHP